MEKGITIRELLKMCQIQVAKGNGNKHILISGDDEGNSFHTLFYGFTDDTTELNYILEIEHDNHTIDEIVALG